jgi:magnesium transporter
MPQEKNLVQQLDSLSNAIEDGALPKVHILLNALHPAEIAHLIESSPVEQRKVIWELVEANNEGEVLIELRDEVRASLVQDMATGEVIAAAKDLDIDDLADFLQSLPNKLIPHILASLDRQNRQRLEKVLAYPEDTAGGMMDTNVITARPNVSIDVVLRYLRRLQQLPSHTDSVFIVDRNNHYLGTLPIAYLLTQQPENIVQDVMKIQSKTIPADMSDNEVAILFEDRNWVSAPVLDKENKLIGRITVDDVVDVIRDEAEHSVLSAAGLDEKDDLFAPVIGSASRRAVWLGTNLMTALLASAVIGQFQSVLNHLVALAILMPIVASMGGVAGSQTLTLVTRGIALGQISKSNIFTLFKRECWVGLINGVLWASVIGLVSWLWFQDYLIGAIIAAAMVINLLVASSCGVILPVMLDKLGIDPALAGSVALTTITDVIGFLAFLGLASFFLLP